MTRATSRQVLALVACAIHFSSATAQPEDCVERASPNSVVENPPELVASAGSLKVALTMRSQQMMEFPLKVCLLGAANGKIVEAPTLRLDPADELDLSLTNRLTYVASSEQTTATSLAPHDPCTGGATATTSTNIDFDGLEIPTTCHQGESSTTTIENSDPAFHYRFRIPAKHPPGLYWYHPHRLGSATLQLDGGASGILIVGGMEKAHPEVAGLPERILVFRQRLDEDESDTWPPEDYRYSLNFQTISPAEEQWPVIQMKPGVKEFWRVANASAQGFLALQIDYEGIAQPVNLVALDGVPVRTSRSLETIELPPGGRAEFIVNGPALGQKARLIQARFDTGPTGIDNAPRQLAQIVAAPSAREPQALATTGGRGRVFRTTRTMPDNRFVTKVRRMYLAEATNGTMGPARFFLTLEGRRPAAFDPHEPPAVTIHVGAVEDWVIANHSGDIHAFHVLHRHFFLLQGNGEKPAEPELRDTVTVPAWDGVGPYPEVRIRLDFRVPGSAGVFEFQDQISNLAEAGMMARFRVMP